MKQERSQKARCLCGQMEESAVQLLTCTEVSASHALGCCFLSVHCGAIGFQLVQFWPRLSTNTEHKIADCMKYPSHLSQYTEEGTTGTSLESMSASWYLILYILYMDIHFTMNFSNECCSFKGTSLCFWVSNGHKNRYFPK